MKVMRSSACPRRKLATARAALAMKALAVATTARTASAAIAPRLIRVRRFDCATESAISSRSTGANSSFQWRSSSTASISGLPSARRKDVERPSACQRAAAAATRPWTRRSSRSSSSQSVSRGQWRSRASWPTLTVRRSWSRLGDQQPRLDQGVDQPARLGADAELGVIGPLAAHCVVAAAHPHQAAQHPRQGSPDLGGLSREGVLGAPCQRPLDAPQALVGGKRQHSVVVALGVELFEGELEQRQGFGALGGGGAQHLVEPQVGVGVVVEGEAGGHRRLADDLAELGGRRAQQVNLAVALLQLHQRRQLAAARIEVAAQGGDDPHVAAAGEDVEEVDKGRPVGVGEVLLGEKLLHLIDQERQAGRWRFEELALLPKVGAGALERRVNPRHQTRFELVTPRCRGAAPSARRRPGRPRSARGEPAGQ